MFVVFVIGCVLHKEAGTTARIWRGEFCVVQVLPGSWRGQPQFQLETGPNWVGAAVHCWVASWVSIDSMALTIVFIGRFLSQRRLTPRETGH